MRKYEAIRTEIKKLSETQKKLKKLRRVHNLSKEQYETEMGVTSQWFYEGTVQIAVVNMKSSLRLLFQAYAILKGKERPKVYKSDMNETTIQKLVEKYKVE